MTGRTRGILFIICILLVCLTSAVWFLVRRRPGAPRNLTVTGVVLADDSDPRKQSPLSNATIMIDAGGQTQQTTSDASGLFHASFTLPAGLQSVSLRFQAAGHRPLSISKVLDDRLVIARLPPAGSEMPRVHTRAANTITHDGVLVRYTTKTTSAVNVGALVNTFEVPNTGNVPCEGSVCSPDGEWKATVTRVKFEAGSGNHFVNARVSCIAGPCPFTRVEANNLSDPGTTIRVSVRNWSDTATFLVEAEVSRIVNGDIVRQSIPAIFGPALSFTLPPGAVGPSIEAEVNGTRIVYPLGPEHKLSWAICNLEVAQSGTQVFRCELKPNYEFK